MKYYLITVSDSNNNIFSLVINEEPQKWFIEYMKEQIANLPYINSPHRRKHAISYSKEITKKDYQELKKLFG